MARPKKYSLDYFPFDTDFFEDDKIMYIEGNFGCKGSYVAIRLLCTIYHSNGYWYKWADMAPSVFTRRLGYGFDLEFVNSVVDELVKCSFFDKEIFESFKILTSHGIQQRYLSSRKTPIRLREDIDLLNRKLDSAKKELPTIPQIDDTTKCSTSANCDTTNVGTISSHKSTEQVNYEAVTKAWMEHYHEMTKIDYVPVWQTHTDNVKSLMNVSLSKMSSLAIEQTPEKIVEFVKEMLNSMYNSADQWQRSHWSLYNVVTQFNQLYRATKDPNKNGLSVQHQSSRRSVTRSTEQAGADF